MIDIIVCMRINRRDIWSKTRSQTKSSDNVLPKVHSVDKGIDPNMQPEKQITKPVVAPQSHVSTELKGWSHVKPWLGQGRADIKKNVVYFPIPWPHDKPEQTKLLPERKSIIKKAERPILQHPQIVM